MSAPAAPGQGALRILVLGAAAGGGLPQWNCRCRGCTAARDGQIPAHGQVSLAVSADDGAHWFLINASPDLRDQISLCPALQPRGPALRHSPIAGVILVNGEVDAVAGLLSMREGQRFSLHATESVLNTLSGNSIFNVLNPANVTRSPMRPGESFEPLLPDGRPSGLEVTPFTVPGKIAWYLEGDPSARPDESGDTIGLTLSATGSGARASVVLACAAVTPALLTELEGSDLLFFDGTLWEDDEMIRQGLSHKTGAAMGHLPISGPEGSLARLAPLRVKRKVFVHINNSNPVWFADSPEQDILRGAGWQIPRVAEEFLL